jgi:predicted nucleic acid-binding protein
MSVRAFLDTNIFVYAVDHGDNKKRATADALIGRAIDRKTGVVSYQVVQEFLNVALKKFVVPFTAEQARLYIGVVFRPLFAVQPSMGLFSDALDIRSRHRLSWYDSLIVAAAVESGCAVFYTEDLSHGTKINGVRIENPFL